MDLFNIHRVERPKCAWRSVCFWIGILRLVWPIAEGREEDKEGKERRKKGREEKKEGKGGEEGGLQMQMKVTKGGEGRIDLVLAFL